MIHEYSGIAVDFSRVKAIRREYTSPGGGYLVFELDNLVHLHPNEETGKLEIHSLPNDPIKHHFDTSDALSAYFDEWVEIWVNWREKETN